MEVCLIIIATVAISILALTAAGLQAIASICKHGGVTIHIIQDSPADKTPIAPNVVLSKEEQDAMDKYNEDQNKFLNSIRNLQKLFIYDEQMTGEDK